jgi:hypothetical protein
LGHRGRNSLAEGHRSPGLNHLRRDIPEGVNHTRLNQLAVRGFLPFEVHVDGTRLYRREQLKVGAEPGMRVGTRRQVASQSSTRLSTNTPAVRVEPICRVLTEHGYAIAPSTYYAARTRPASGGRSATPSWTADRRGPSDRDKGRWGRRGPAGVAPAQARRRGQGSVHGRTADVRARAAWHRSRQTVVTTRPDPSPATTRAPDLVQRIFTAPRPRQL